MVERVRVAVVGAGPAGIAAGVYLQRYGLRPLLLEQGEPGGLLREANLVENYPGFPEGIPGRELVALFVRQMDRLGVRVERARVGRVAAADGGFTIDTDHGPYAADNVVVASGTVPRRISVPGTDALERAGRLFHGLSMSPFEDLAGAKVVIVGGGDAAFDYSLNLRGRGHDVVVLSRSEPSCLPLLVDRAEKAGVDVRTGVDVERFEETDGGLVAICAGCEVDASAVVVACGREPRLEFLHDNLKSKLVDVPSTAVPGLYVAGDVVRGRNRQTAIAVGDGVLAAMMIERSISEQR
jgi:thioredoxin reductase (NADPH)